jgi:biopolymer transport protein ExbD
MKKRSLSAQDETTSEIDLTPMLDVVFIMLIFFIVTATFIREPGVEVVRPEAVTGDFVKNQKILVAITANDQVWFDKRPVADHQIRAAIEKVLAENPKGAVVIQADRGSTAGKVALVMDAAKKAGVASVSLATRR